MYRKDKKIVREFTSNRHPVSPYINLTYVTTVPLSKLRNEHWDNTVNSISDFIWIFPLFPLTFFFCCRIQARISHRI